jgi:hypothetical protein
MRRAEAHFKDGNCLAGVYMTVDDKKAVPAPIGNSERRSTPMSHQSSERLIFSDAVSFIHLRRTDCPDDFTVIGHLELMRKTKKELEKALDDEIAAAVKDEEKQLDCDKYTCKEGDCEFDYMVEKDPPRKIFQKTQKRGKKRRWIGSATILAGCFCPGSSDDPEDDPK